MDLLSIETSGQRCSAALSVGGRVIQRYAEEPRRHGERILAMVRDLLAEADIPLNRLDALVFGRGPGSFTGVRIGAGVVQGLAFGADLPVAPISSLAGLAQGVHRMTRARRVLAALDARMGELYWGCYTLDPEDRMTGRGEEMVAPAEAVPLPEGTGWHGAGSGWPVYGERLRARLGNRLATIQERPSTCEARDLLPLAAAVGAGQWVPPEQALPLYIRNRVADPAGSSQ